MSRAALSLFVMLSASFPTACGSVDSKPPVENNGTANNGEENNGAANNGQVGSNNTTGMPPQNNGIPANNGATNNTEPPVNNGQQPDGRLFETNGDGVLTSDEIEAGCRAAEACNQAQFNEAFDSVATCLSETEQQRDDAVATLGEECETDVHLFLECSLGTSTCTDGELGGDEAAQEACSAAFEETGCAGT